MRLGQPTYSVSFLTMVLRWLTSTMCSSTSLCIRRWRVLTQLQLQVDGVDEQRREGWSALHCAAHRHPHDHRHCHICHIWLTGIHTISNIVIFFIVKVTLLATRMAKLSSSFSLSTFLFEQIEQAQEQGGRPLARSRGAQGFARQRRNGSDSSGCQGL